MLGIYDFVYAYCAVVCTDSGFCLEKKEKGNTVDGSDSSTK
jgi:hypothetical protein